MRHTALLARSLPRSPLNHAPPSARRTSSRSALPAFDASRRGAYPAAPRRAPAIRQAALPRFALADEVVDPSEAVATAPRAAMTPARVARAMRGRADSTQEVKVEDILLEVWTDPPPSRRVPAAQPTSSTRPASSAHRAPSSPSPSEQRAVDALLADPEPRVEMAPPPSAWAPPPMSASAWPSPARAFSTPPLPLPAHVDDEAPPPSIAPVTASVEIVSGARARELVAASSNASPSGSAGRILLVGLCLLLAGLAMGVAIAFAFPEGPLGRLLRAAPNGRAVAVATSAPPAVAPAAQPAPAMQPAPATPRAPAAAAPRAPVAAAPPAPVVTPQVPVAAPAPIAVPAPAAPAARSVPSGGVLVLPPNAAGHRVWIDRTVVDGSSRSIEVPCGPHKVKVGSHGHARRVVVPCGGTLTL
jgi:hypothetical protein